MLVSLSVRNVVLIEQLALEFDKGLSALTGETGAGKSILLDALGLALGQRADTSLVRRGADQAVVTASFACGEKHPSIDLLNEHGIPVEDNTLILRRVVSPDGRSRAYINDQPVSVALLRGVGETLVEVHGQFDTQGLLDPKTHAAVLDEFAGLGTELAACGSAWQGWKKAEKAKIEAEQALHRSAADEEYLRHAVDELDKLAAQPGEEGKLSELRAVLANREKLAEAITVTEDSLSGETGVETGLNAARAALDRVKEQDGGILAPLTAALDRTAAELSEAVAALHSVSADLGQEDHDPDSVAERLFALRDVARKHGCAPDELPEKRDELAHKLELIDNREDALAELQRECEKRRQDYVAAAEKLSEKRVKSAATLDAAVAAELPPLKLDKATFVTSVNRRDEDGWGPEGMDDIAFTVATNPGAAPGPLHRIASGGELARFMLALKVCLAETATIPVLVFDEVDSGIGGATAHAVGERLARLGEQYQVLVVTHSPQVAARARNHAIVAKQEVKGATVTSVITLDPNARQEEIARMLSGADITAEARAAAAKLMDASHAAA